MSCPQGLVLLVNDKYELTVKKHLFYVLWMVVLQSYQSPGQDYYYNDRYYERPILIEGGMILGGINCLTDLGGGQGAGKRYFKDLNLPNTNYCIGIHLGLTYEYSMAIRLMAITGKICGYDSIIREDATVALLRRERNLSFQSNITEVSVAAEFYLLGTAKASPERKRPMIAPFICAGIGVFHFDPQASLNGKWYSLHSFDTEGEGFPSYPDRKPYSLTQLNYQAGVGFRYEVSALLHLRFEIIYRVLRTDYLDDVSTNYVDPKFFEIYLPPEKAFIARQLADRRIHGGANQRVAIGEKRGDSKNMDSYFTCMARFGYILNRIKAH